MEIVQEIRKSEIVCHTRKYKQAQSHFHWHENYEICQVLRKPCNFRVDGQLIEANVGDIIAINEHIIHQFLIPNDDTDIRVFQFPLKILMNFSSSIEPLKVHIKREEILSVPELEQKLDTLFGNVDHDQGHNGEKNDQGQAQNRLDEQGDADAADEQNGGADTCAEGHIQHIVDGVGVAGHSRHQRGNGEGVRLGGGKRKDLVKEIAPQFLDDFRRVKGNAAVCKNIGENGNECAQRHHCSPEKYGEKILGRTAENHLVQNVS